MNTQFPIDFMWGTATSSYQIEGAADVDGKGESIWDRFCKLPGKIDNADTGEIACDHYHRYREDVALLKELGVDTYRFSVSWPRIFPKGAGDINEKGLDFYKRLIDELLKNEITPFLTLYHWDLPQALQDKGGWTNRDMTEYFLEYATTLFHELGDVVKHWITHNEPWVVSYLGYADGEHAPGYQDFRSFVKASHHLLLSHGKAVSEFRRIAPKDGKIGITLNLEPAYPLYDNEDCRKAAQMKEGFFNRWFLDPLYKSQYPKDMLDHYGEKMSLDFIEADDLALISQPTDFLGVNYYSISTLAPDMEKPDDFLPFQALKTGKPVTAMGWEVYPQGLVDLLTWIKDEYGDMPLYITENGAAYPDAVEADGTVQDDRRLQFIRQHVEACREVIDKGVNLKGYFLWSLLDNFEWAFGYDKRFGIVHVDFETLKRTPKKSFYWYQEWVKQQKAAAGQPSSQS